MKLNILSTVISKIYEYFSQTFTTTNISKYAHTKKKAFCEKKCILYCPYKENCNARIRLSIN